MRIQSGFTTFTVTLILLLILLAVTLLVGKLLVADRRITLNETLYRQVMALAEQGCPMALVDYLLKVHLALFAARLVGNSFSPSGAGGLIP